MEDKPSISSNFNPAKKKGAKVRPDLSFADVDGFIKTPRSRRSLLTICNTDHYPLKLVNPFTIKTKILLKESLSLNSVGDWDPPASTSLIKEQAAKLKEAIMKLKEIPELPITHNSTRIRMGSIQIFSRMSADYVIPTFVLEICQSHFTSTNNCRCCHSL